MADIRNTARKERLPTVRTDNLEKEITVEFN